MKHLVVLAILALAVPAAADSIVLESFTGGKTEAAAKQLVPLLEALANRGYASGPELNRKFESAVSRKAIQQGLPADFAVKIDQGYSTFSAGQFQQAIAILGPLLDLAHANTGAFAKDQPKRDLLFKGLVVLALSYYRLGDKAMMEKTFGELMRSFSQAPSAAIYGAQALQLYNGAQQTLAAGGRGKLEVRTNVDNAIVYINEKIEGSGTIARDGLLPGEYRVFAQSGKLMSRSHRVVVKPNDQATLVIDLPFDAAVQTTPNWTGLAYDTPADREREYAHAAMFANALGAEAVVIVGIIEERGKPAIKGSLVNKISNTWIRAAQVQLDPAPTVAQLTDLADYLVGVNPKPQGVEIITAEKAGAINIGGGGGGDGGSIVTPGGRGSERGWGGWKFVSGGLGAAALGTGVVLLLLDGGCRTDAPPGTLCTDVWNTGTPAYLALGGGAVLTGISIYLFVRKDGKPSRTAFVAPTGDGVLAGFAGRF